jgi:hypothetical protein
MVCIQELAGKRLLQCSGYKTQDNYHYVHFSDANFTHQTIAAWLHLSQTNQLHLMEMTQWSNGFTIEIGAVE